MEMKKNGGTDYKCFFHVFQLFYNVVTLFYISKVPPLEIAVKPSAGLNKINSVGCHWIFFIIKKSKKKKKVLSIYYICWAEHWEEKKFKLKFGENMSLSGILRWI